MDLPGELQSELELSRIVSCRWLPGQARGARRGIAQLVHCGDVGVIGKVEIIGDQVEAEAFAEVDGFGDAQVETGMTNASCILLQECPAVQQGQDELIRR